MSRLYYFAGDRELAEQPNPYVELLSVNEALARGVKIDQSFFREDFDCDEPGVILYCASEDAFDHPNIYRITPDEYYDDVGTRKANCAVLEWDWCEAAAHEVLAYIAAQLETMDALELWSVWLGSDDIPRTVKRVTIAFAELTPTRLREFLQADGNHCMTIQK